jgi:hypothetical protein
MGLFISCLDQVKLRSFGSGILEESPNPSGFGRKTAPCHPRKWDLKPLSIAQN